MPLTVHPITYVMFFFSNIIPKSIAASRTCGPSSLAARDLVTFSIFLHMGEDSIDPIGRASDGRNVSFIRNPEDIDDIKADCQNFETMKVVG